MSGSTSPGCPRVTLAIETSTREGSIAILTGGEHEPVEMRLDADRSHGSDLMPAIDAALLDRGLGAGDIDLIVIGRGPGSYTGLRVGAATALGLMRGTGAALVGVPSLDALAAAAALESADEPLPAFRIARFAFGGQLYVADYRSVAGDVSAVGAPLACSISAAAKELRADQPTFADVRAASALREVSLAPVQAEALRETPPNASAATLLKLGARRHEEIGDAGAPDAAPLYLRPFEAKVRKR